LHIWLRGDGCFDDSPAITCDWLLLARTSRSVVTLRPDTETVLLLVQKVVPVRTGTFSWTHDTNLTGKHSMTSKRREVLDSKPALVGPDFGPDFSVAAAGSGSV
jgi:hypothetical protein